MTDFNEKRKALCPPEEGDDHEGAGTTLRVPCTEKKALIQRFGRKHFRRKGKKSHR